MIQLKKIDPKVVLLITSLILTGAIMLMLGPADKLDGRFYYSAEEAEAYLKGLTLVERGFYLYGESLDFWFMTNYSWLLFLGFRFFSAPTSSFKYLAFFPGVLDFIETISIMGFLIQGHALINLSTLSIISCLKWNSVVLSFVFILFRLIRLKK